MRFVCTAVYERTRQSAPLHGKRLNTGGHRSWGLEEGRRDGRREEGRAQRKQERKDAQEWRGHEMIVVHDVSTHLTPRCTQSASCLPACWKPSRLPSARRAWRDEVRQQNKREGWNSNAATGKWWETHNRATDAVLHVSCSRKIYSNQSVALRVKRDTWRRLSISKPPGLSSGRATAEPMRRATRGARGNREGATQDKRIRVTPTSLEPARAGDKKY